VHIVVQKLGLSCHPIEARPKVVYRAPRWIAHRDRPPLLHVIDRWGMRGDSSSQALDPKAAHRMAWPLHTS